MVANQESRNVNLNLTRKNCSDGKDLNANLEECSKQINELIDHKCRQLSKTKTGKGSAIHLAEWMKGQLGNSKEDIPSNTEAEVWIQEDASKRMSQMNIESLSNRQYNKYEEDLFSEKSKNTDGSHHSLSTSESQSTIKSNHQEKTVSVCRKCHKTCLNSEEKHGLRDNENIAEEEDCETTSWGSLMMMGMCGILPQAVKSLKDPFAPAEPPSISVLPPTPDKKIKNTNSETEVNCSFYSKCNSTTNCSDKYSGGPCAIKDLSSMTPVPTLKTTHVKSTDLNETDDDDTVEEVASEELPYKTLQSSGLRRFGTMNSLERVSSDDPLDQDDQEDETAESDKDEEDEEKIEVKTHPPEVGDSIRGWTVRAGSFVAAKMAFFERISSPDNSVTVRKTTFLERYLKPSGENHLDSSADPGTNTPSSGRGEEEGETSGATSGEEIWGTPTSGGELEEELVGESAALSFVESPRGSIETDDDTEQLMEDLLISLPMLAARSHGVPPRRRLEPLLEEDDTESSSTPCSPKPIHDSNTGEGRGLTGSLLKHPENSPKIGNSQDLFIRKETTGRPRIGTIDRALGIHSDEEDEAMESVETSPSLLKRLGLRRNVNREECGRKGNRLLGFLSSRKVETNVSNRNSATYGAKPLFRYLFNKDSDDDIPTTLPREFSSPRRNEKQLERRFWKQLKRRRTTTPASTTTPNSSVLQSTSPQIAV